MMTIAVPAITASDKMPISKAISSADALESPIAWSATTALSSRRPQPPKLMGRLAASITMQDAAASEAMPICGASAVSSAT